MPIIARYTLEADARERAEEEGLPEPELRPSKRWPEHPWALIREVDGLDRDMDSWGERLLEGDVTPQANGRARRRDVPGSD